MKLLATVREGYRADIDGLRALAVLSVVLFHIDKSWVPGGFIGVDIFFVISGFLITGNIAQDIERGSFKVTEFYRRRIRRIMPALSVVLLTCLLVGQILLLPEDMQNLTLSAIASQLFVANFYFLLSVDTSYFADETTLQPLIHLWTLGVEEQFYLIWPLALCAIGARRFNRILIGSLVLVAVASFIAAQMIAPEAPMAAYYMLPTRVGQLLAGALCYFFLQQIDPAQPFADRVRECVGWGSLALIVASLIWINQSMTYPGVLAIPVTLGSAGLLLIGNLGGSYVTRILTFRPLVWTGLISYSLYLWHWPVVAFARYFTGDLNLAGKGLALVVIFLLAWLSYRWVEAPFRVTRAGFRRVFLAHLVLPTVLIGLAFIGIRATHGFGFWQFNSGYVQRLAQLGPDNVPRILPSTASPFTCQGVHLDQTDVTLPACRINSVGEPNALLWGDSNAGHYVGTVRAIAERLGFSFRNIAHAACPPLLRHASDFANPRTADRCEQSVSATLEVLDAYQSIILAANWEHHLDHSGDRFLEELRGTLAELGARGLDVLVIGRLPQLSSVDHDCERKRLRVPFITCRNHGMVRRAAADEVNATIRALAEAAGARYVDFNDYLCPDGHCRSVIGEVNAYYNVGHLSQRGGELLGQAVINDNAILAAFRPIVAISPSDMPAIPGGQAADRLPSLIDLLLPDIWSNRRALPMTSGLMFRDESDTAYQSTYLTLAPGTLPASDARMLTVTTVFRRLDSSRPLLRIGTTAPAGRFDFIVNAQGDGVDLRRGQPETWTAQVDDDFIQLTATIPFDPANSELRLDILPAVATLLNDDYSVTATGSILLADFAINYATIGAPAEPSP
ncbi:acyltransferase family protein [Maricaulis sp.]|uniref:acyltransferase family protein n=1 Tax=Maricaulis sp. TaxID=1486257 RepID=UPI003A8E529A